MSEKQKHTLEERIAFVARYYRENSLDVEKRICGEVLSGE